MCEYWCVTEDDMLVIHLSGRLDSVSVPQVESQILNLAGDTKDAVFDCSDLYYVSSAGLRLFLMFRKRMNAHTLRLVNVSDDILEVLDVTGFVDILSVSGKMEAC